jgi:hypothetical protein
MPISRVNFQKTSIPPATDSGGGGGDAGAWTNLTAADLSTDNGSYSTFNVTASSEADFNINVEIAADTGTANNSFPLGTAGVVYIDTGIDKDSLANGDQRTCTIQLMVEFDNMGPTSPIITDTTYRASICPFMIADVPPYASGDKGMFGGSGFFGGSTAPQRTASRLLRSTASSNNAGTLWNAASDRLVAILNEMTLVQGYVSGTGAQAFMFRYDSLGFWSNTSTDNALFTLNDSKYDSSNTNIGSNTIRIGVAFHVNGGTDAATTKSWDINIKWRKLLSEA